MRGQDARGDGVDIFERGRLPPYSAAANVRRFHYDVSRDFALETDAPLILSGGTAGVVIEQHDARGKCLVADRRNGSDSRAKDGPSWFGTCRNTACQSHGRGAQTRGTNRIRVHDASAVDA